MAPVKPSRSKRSPFADEHQGPLRAGPSGGGSGCWEPTVSEQRRRGEDDDQGEDDHARRGTGANGNRRVATSMGSHLSGNVQAGRWRMRAVCRTRSSR